MNPNELSKEELADQLSLIESSDALDFIKGHITSLTQRLQEVGQKAVDDFTSAHHNPIVSQKNEEIRRLAERVEEVERTLVFAEVSAQLLQQRLTTSEIKCAELREGLELAVDMAEELAPKSHTLTCLKQALTSTPDVSDWVKKGPL